MQQPNRDNVLRAAAPLIELAVTEDIGPGDVTGAATLPADAILHGYMIAKASGIIAGLAIAAAVFRRVEPAIDFRPYVVDGQVVMPGEIIAEVKGPGRGILAAERLALNFLQRMSGIATATGRFVDAVACTHAAILDTRKTAPGFRVLDKYAVRAGGGANHRMGLYDMVLIKDNHVEACGGIVQAIEKVRASHPTLPVEVEVRNLEELRQALSIQPPLDRIMLDNMDLETTRQAVQITAGRVPLEASGNARIEHVADIAAAGVDYISVGALTHSVAALDISLDIRPSGGASPAADILSNIARHRAALGKRLVILGHHYQREDVLACADRRGDSLELARQATQTEAELIVFCGVRFMAETAAVLCRPGQRVFATEPGASCYLADTATLEAVEAAWAQMDAVFGDATTAITPVTYVNSSATLKAFCGRHGGIVCTSGNAEKVLQWAMEQRRRVFFFPDQHLGRNTCRKLGIPTSEMLQWDIDRPPQPSALHAARVLLWPGCCNVHQRFRPEHVHAVRARLPGVRVIVHPECRSEVVDLADDTGSTAYIIRQVEAAGPGAQWAIGTEARLVERLCHAHPDQTIISLSAVPAFCPSMSQTTPASLEAVLASLADGEPVHEVRVDAETRAWARLALERMLALG